jgi:hypothetical protein
MFFQKGKQVESTIRLPNISAKYFQQIEWANNF